MRWPALRGPRPRRVLRHPCERTCHRGAPTQLGPDLASGCALSRSARTALSPSGSTRTLTRGLGRAGSERRGGMCAHKDGVEHAGDEAHAEQANACNPDGPGGHDRGDDHVPRGEVTPQRVQRGDRVEQVARIATRRESRRRTRYEEQHHESPRQGEDEDGKDVRERRTDEVSKWTQQEGEWGW